MAENTQRTLLARYQRLIEIARDLASTLDLATLLNRIVGAAADLCQAENASILLFDEVKGELYFEAATNMDLPTMGGLAVPVDSSIAGWIITNRKPIIIADVGQDERHFAKVSQTTQTTTRSLLGAPMIAKEKVVGALEAINKINGEFNQDDQEILLTLGAQAAIAIENARLFQQSDLISEFVHELRTPLSSLNTAAHLLLHPGLDDSRRQQMVQTIQGETSRLSEMATSFLDVARLESGRAPFKLRSIELARLLQDCASIMQTQAAEKDLTFELDLEPGQCTIEGDYDKLKQAFLNLLSNAIKYNRPNGRVLLRTCRDEQGCTITVADTGIGVPEEHLEHLFTKFFRVPGSEKHAQGTGLGLIIVKRVIEGHRGTIRVESNPGEGTTFVIQLPAGE